MQTRAAHPEQSNAEGEKRAVILRLVGDIDREAAESCEWMLHSAGAAARHVVLDLTEARTFDSRGLPILVARARKLRSQGGEMVVATTAVAVRSVIQARTSELTVLPSVNEAIDVVEGRVELAGTAGRSSLFSSALRRRF